MNSRDQVNLALRIAGAALVLAGGIIHFKLWNDGYRHIDKIGPSFLLNAIGSAAVAIVLVVWRNWLATIAGLGVVNGTLLAFGLSRTDRGILDFTERGWNPSPEAALALVFELAAAAVLIALLLVGDEKPAAARPGTPFPPPPPQ